MIDQSIIFMGTPEFAVASLDALIADGVQVRAVVTAPDRPAGRGRLMRSSPVKMSAQAHGIPVLQPERLRDPAFLHALDELKADLFIVVAFRMLPEVVWSRPRLGTVNLHGSLLPAYRGAAPINWAVINGEAFTGVSTFQLQHAIDTGDILLSERAAISPDETAGDLHDRLMRIGAQLIVRTVRGLFTGQLMATPQAMGGSATHAPKLDAQNTRIRFDRPATQVHNLVRGLSPFPGAWCNWTPHDGDTVHCKVLRTAMMERGEQAVPGTLKVDGEHLFVACSDGWLEILELQLEGRKRMPAAALLRGIRMENGVRLT